MALAAEAVPALRDYQQKVRSLLILLVPRKLTFVHEKVMLWFTNIFYFVTENARVGRDLNETR